MVYGGVGVTPLGGPIGGGVWTPTPQKPFFGVFGIPRITKIYFLFFGRQNFGDFLDKLLGAQKVASYGKIFPGPKKSL